MSGILLDLLAEGGARPPVQEGVGYALESLGVDLGERVFGGGELVVIAAAQHVPSGKTYDLYRDHIGDKRTLAARNLTEQLLAVSCRLGISSRQAAACGLTGPDESAGCGSAVVPLNADATLRLVVACAGVSTGGDNTPNEAYAELIAASVKLDLIRAVALIERADKMVQAAALKTAA